MPHARIQQNPAFIAALLKKIVVLTASIAIAMAVLMGSAKPAEAAMNPTSLSGIRSAIVHLTNVQRAVKGCKPLKSRAALTRSAQGHARDMSRKHYFSHTSADGRSWITRIKRAGWKNPAGENIAYGFGSAFGVVRAWMNSPGHRRNIMDCDFRYIGVGYTKSGKYWVQDFGY